jgi:hypothetical protein
LKIHVEDSKCWRKAFLQTGSTGWAVEEVLIGSMVEVLIEERGHKKGRGGTSIERGIRSAVGCLVVSLFRK